MKFKTDTGNFELKVKEISVGKTDRSNSRGQVHVFVEGESLLENLFYRRDRPYKYYRQLMPDVLKFVQNNLKCKSDIQKRRKINITNENFMSMGWSQYAGCSCGCSPGFILKHDDMRGFEFYVTIKIKGK